MSMDYESVIIPPNLHKMKETDPENTQMTAENVTKIRENEENEASKISATSSKTNWGWFNILNPKANNNHPMVAVNDSEFEVVQQDPSTSQTQSDENSDCNIASEINDQYMKQKEQQTINKNKIIKSNNIENVQENHEKNTENDNEAVMISQTLTLRSRNDELEKERDELQSETLQLRMQTECLKQSNHHIITAQQQEIEILQNNNAELQKSLNNSDLQLKNALDELARTKRERDNLQTKIQDICYNRLQTRDSKEINNVNKINEDIRDNKNCVIYSCNSCGEHLFDSTAMVQRQIEMDDNKYGCLVDDLFNNDEITMGPKICKNFVNGMFKVNQIFCDGCLTPFGFKIIESFEEWNTFFQGKYCIDISSIKQITF